MDCECLRSLFEKPLLTQSYTDDRILILSNGEVVEFDTPVALLQKPGGKLREMCKAGGPEAYAELRVAAGLPAADELDELDTQKP